MICRAAAQTSDTTATLGPNCTRDEGELAEDWLATLVRDTLRDAGGAVAPPDTVWQAIERRLEEERAQGQTNRLHHR
jgi:hypothetical protein